jgi:nucleotide-binding universal stress UspA family protein
MAVIGSEQDTNSVKRAIGLCASTSCHLAVTVIGVALPAGTSVYGAIPADTWAQEREAGKQTTDRKASAVEKQLADAGISGDVSSWYCDEGQVPSVVGARARYTDLGLVFQDGGVDRRVADRALEAFIYHSAKPFLIVPKSVTPTLSPKTVMIAWNATKEGARTVHLAMDMLAEAEKVNVVMVDPTGGEFDQGEEPGNDIATYLARNGINVTVETIPSAGKSVAETLLRHATDLGADLIVAGAYGHSRLREFLFGGTTRDLLANDKFAVFAAH